VQEFLSFNERPGVFVVEHAFFSKRPKMSCRRKSSKKLNLRISHISEAFSEKD